jgi:hypothetical protein
MGNQCPFVCEVNEKEKKGTLMRERERNGEVKIK